MGKQITISHSYGKTGYVWIDGRKLWCSSMAEGIFLREIEPAILAGELQLRWQEVEYAYEYRHAGQVTVKTYRPDAVLTWVNRGLTEVIEVKRRVLYQHDRTKLKRVAQQNSDIKLVLVWVGPMPGKGPVAKHLEQLRPHIDHIWMIKAPKEFMFDE